MEKHRKTYIGLKKEMREVSELIRYKYKLFETCAAGYNAWKNNNRLWKEIKNLEKKQAQLNRKLFHYDK